MILKPCEQHDKPVQPEKFCLMMCLIVFPRMFESFNGRVQGAELPVSECTLEPHPRALRT